MNWSWWMYVCAVVGSLAGLLWPLLVAAWKKQTAQYTLDASDTLAPFARWIVRIAKFGALALVLSAIAAAVGFAAFMGDDANRDKLKDLGDMAYFFAFTYGFGAASLVSPALKK